MELIYQDPRIIVAVKPAGILSTDEPGGMPELIRKELDTPQACIRTVHRLDQAVGGLMVFARSRMAASILSRQIRAHEFEKEYLAVVRGTLPAPSGTFCDLLLHDRESRMTRVVDAPGKDVQQAILDYRLLESAEELSLVKISLQTGRTHQIRVQFSSRNLPLAGDRKYGADDSCPICLWSWRLCFTHPQSGVPLQFCKNPPSAPLWDRFQWFSS